MATAIGQAAPKPRAIPSTSTTNQEASRSPPRSRSNQNVANHPSGFPSLSQATSSSASSGRTITAPASQVVRTVARFPRRRDVLDDRERHLHGAPFGLLKDAVQLTLSLSWRSQLAPSASQE